jgi:hypothetical protein
MPNTPPRPRLLSKEGLLTAAIALATELENMAILPDCETLETAAADIAKVGQHEDCGYSLGKDLEQYHYWEMDAATVETLDGWSHHKAAQMKIEQTAWFEANKIQPPYPDGTTVRAKYGNETIEGVIKDVYAHGVGQYRIEVGRKNSWPVVYFEDVTAVEDKKDEPHEA